MAVDEDEARYLLCCESDLLIYIESSDLGLGSIPSSYALPEPLSQGVGIWYRKKCGFGSRPVMLPLRLVEDIHMGQ